MRGRRLLPGFALAGALLSAPAAAQEPDAEGYRAMEREAAQPGTVPATVLEAARRNGSYTTFLQAVEAAGWSERLRGRRGWTVFAPTDAAFAALPPGTLADVLQDKRRLHRLMADHLVPRRLTAEQIGRTRTLRTAGGRRLTHTHTGGGLQIEGAEVVEPDVEAGNGILHGIDRVLLPAPGAAAAGSAAGSAGGAAIEREVGGRFALRGNAGP